MKQKIINMKRKLRLCWTKAIFLTVSFLVIGCGEKKAREEAVKGIDALATSDIAEAKEHLKNAKKQNSEIPEIKALRDGISAYEKAQKLFGDGFKFELEKGKRTFTWIDNPNAYVGGGVYLVNGKKRFLEWKVGANSVIFDLESGEFIDQPNGKLLAEIQPVKEATVILDNQPMQVSVRFLTFKDDTSERAKTVYDSLGISTEGTAMVYEYGKLDFVAYKCGGKWFFCNMNPTKARDAIMAGDFQ